MTAGPPLKDEEAEHPIAPAWRPVFRRIVHAFVVGDYALKEGIDEVDPVAEDVAHQIAAYVQDYGATLVDLSEETWTTSVARWMGHRWQALVDLRTDEEGRSDLVLTAVVREVGEGYRFEVQGVWVP